MEFEKLPLHDAIIERIEYSWESKLARIFGTLCSESRTSFILSFIQTSALSIPQKEEWGPSSSINDLEFDGSIYSVNTQSGDRITFQAAGFSFERKNT